MREAKNVAKMLPPHLKVLRYLNEIFLLLFSAFPFPVDFLSIFFKYKMLSKQNEILDGNGRAQLSHL